MGNLPVLVKKAMGDVYQVGILRCATEAGTKMTLVGDAVATKELVRSGAASDPTEIAALKNHFPVILRDWPYRIRNGQTAT